MKTPEQLAEEYERFNWCVNGLKSAFLAGYQAAKDTYKDAISAYEDVAKQMLEEAVRIMSPKDQFADTGKVIRLVWEQIWSVVPPSTDSGSTPLFNETVLGYTRDGRMVFACHVHDGWVIESDGMERPMSYITHYMPLPEAPKGEK